MLGSCLFTHFSPPIKHNESQLADFDFLTVYIPMLSLHKTVQFHAEKFKSAFHLPPATHLHWHNVLLGLKALLLIVPCVFYPKFLHSTSRLFPMDTANQVLMQPHRSEPSHCSPKEDSQNRNSLSFDHLGQSLQLLLAYLHSLIEI